MHQAKFSLTESQIAFLEQHSAHGFKDKSEVVRTALERLQQELFAQELERSAELYAQTYGSQDEAWVEDATRDWPD